MDHFLFLSYNISFGKVNVCFLTNKKDVFYLLDNKTMTFKTESLLNFTWFLTANKTVNRYVQLKIEEKVFNYLLSDSFDKNNLNDISKLSSILKMEELFI